MNYVYDILLNFQKEYYDFFEWNNDDEITHIRKIPLFKISNSDFKSLKSGNIRINKNFMHKIYNKTQKFKKSKTKNINYAFLVSNGKEILGIKLNKNGLNTYKSSLLLDEEEEINDIAQNLNKSIIEYQIISDFFNNDYQTRKEKKIKQLIIEKLNHLFKNKDNDKLKYLYLEYFNKPENNINIIYSKLKKEIENNPKKHYIIYNFFELIETKQKG